MQVFHDLPARVTVYEVGPRDGLQNEPSEIPTEITVQFVNMLTKTGLPVVEVTSFVRPGSIPQLADAEGVLAGIDRNNHAQFTALVPNQRGMERAADSELDGIASLAGVVETSRLLSSATGRVPASRYYAAAVA